MERLSLYNLFMGRGSDEGVSTVSSRRAALSRGNKEEQDQRLQILGLEKEDVPKKTELIAEVRELVRYAISLNDQEYLASHFTRWGDLTAFYEEIEKADPFERLMMQEILQYMKCKSGLLPKEYLEGLREDLIPGDWSDAEVLVLEALRKYLPLLHISSQSMEIFQKQILDQLALDKKASDEEIFSALIENSLRSNPAGREDRIFSVLRALADVALSKDMPHVKEAEAAVLEDLPWAREKSSVAGREVEDPPLVIDGDSFFTWWRLGHGQGHPGCVSGVAFETVGTSGVEATVVIVNSEEGQSSSKEVGGDATIDRERLRMVMVHEMIHDTQDLTAGLRDIFESEKDQNGVVGLESDSFPMLHCTEGLTQGLTLLRINGDVSCEGEFLDYVREVAFVYQILADSSISPSDYEDRLHYLNSLGPRDALEVLSHWSGQGVEEIKEGWRDVIRKGPVDMEKEETVMHFIEDVLRRALA